MSFGGEASASKTKQDEDINKIVSGTSTTTEGLDISQEAVDKITKDLLGSTNGLASIFGGEQNAGIFNSSVAAQAAGDLSANIVGEIAKLKAKKVSTTDMEEETESERRLRESTASISVNGSFP